MLAAVRRVMGSKHRDIDDIAQDAVIALLGALQTFRGECSVVHFAKRVAVLTALSRRRRVGIENRCSDTDATGIENVPDSNGSPWAAAVSQRRRELVQQLLDELPDVLAEALALHFAFGYTVKRSLPPRPSPPTPSGAACAWASAPCAEAGPRRAARGAVRDLATRARGNP